MGFVLGLAQCRHPEDGDVIALVERFCEEAVVKDVRLLVFPESLMTRYERALDEFLDAAQPLDGPFCRAIDALAAKHGLWIVYAVNELNPVGKPFNTAVVVDDVGVQQGVYRKVHLFDTDFTHESDRMGQGDALFDPVVTPFCTLGLGVCYDLRFPEVARHAALGGADLLLYPAAWVDGPLKAEQWHTLLAARAIENELFVAGLSRADEGYVGQSLIAGPRGEVLARAGRGEELLVAHIEPAELADVRWRMPVLAHRRPELYD